MCTVMAGIAALGGLMQYRAARQQAKAESAYYSAMAEQNATNAKIAEQQRSHHRSARRRRRSLRPYKFRERP